MTYVKAIGLGLLFAVLATTIVTTIQAYVVMSSPAPEEGAGGLNYVSVAVPGRPALVGFAVGLLGVLRRERQKARREAELEQPARMPGPTIH